MDTATLRENRMPQDLITQIETELNPFDLELTDDIDKLDDRMTTAINLMERILAESLTQIQDNKMNQSLAQSNYRHEHRPEIYINALGESSKLSVK